MNALTAFGLLLQVLGGLVAFWGLIKTHDAYADRTVLTIVKNRAARVRDRLGTMLRRLLRRRTGHVVGAGGALGFGGALNARAVIAYGPVPPRMPLRDAINLLDERLRQTSERLTRLEGSVESLADESRTELKRLREDVEREVVRFRELVRNAAIEGLMTEAVGLVMVTIGAVVQGVGSAGTQGG